LSTACLVVVQAVLVRMRERVPVWPVAAVVLSAPAGVAAMYAVEALSAR
jgi:hypothetical protein